MIERPGRVIAIHSQSMEVEFDTASACGQCRSKTSCHGEHSARTVALPLEPGLAAGDTVTLSMAGSSLNLSALLAYLLPASILMLGAWLGDAWQGDSGAMAGAALGLGSGLLVARLLTHALALDQLQPQVHGCFQTKPISTGSST